MKMLLGLLYPTNGSARPGRIVAHRHEGTDQVSPEESYLYPSSMQSRRSTPRRCSGWRATRRKKAEELLDLVGLKDAKLRPVKEYSKEWRGRWGWRSAINDRR